jgi:integrase
MLTYWRGLFPNAQPKHFILSAEKYGFAGNEHKKCSYEIDPSTPMQRWKVGWESARKAANVCCRFHDLRHTFISRLAESHASDSTVMALAGHVSRAMKDTATSA